MESARNVVEVSADVEIVKIPITDVHPNDWNPNQLSDSMFNRLVSDMQSIGFLQPVLVTPREEGGYRIVDGEHRFECARLLDMEEIPCVVIAGDFAKDETAQKLQTMRMNMIRGDVDKRKLTALVTDLVTKMPLEDVAEGMAFDDVDAIRSLIEDARKSLPPEMRKEFDKAKEEIKTVDDLSLVLNRLFTKFGNTLPYNYMIMDFGGKDHIWVRLPDKKAYQHIKGAAEVCRDGGVTFSSVVLNLLSEVSEDYLEKNIDKLEVAENDNSNANRIEDQRTEEDQETTIEALIG